MSPPIPELEIAGLSLGPGLEAEASTRRTPAPHRHPRNAFKVQERRQPTVSEDTSVYVSAQKGQQGYQPRRSWYKPSKVPDRALSGRDRSTCPWRWKNLCHAQEHGSSGSMCAGHKLRVCQELATREDLGNVAKVAQQATISITKSGVLHDTEQMLLTASRVNRLSAQRPSSAPCRQPNTSSRGVTPQCPSPASRNSITRPQSAGNLCSSQSAQQRPPTNQLQNALRSSAPVLQQPQLATRPQSAGLAPAVGSALRVGTTSADIQRQHRHLQLRTHGGQKCDEHVQAWEEHLSMRSQGRRDVFDSRLHMLERHHRLPTPSQTIQRYSLPGDVEPLP